MKKIISLLMALALATGAAALPAVAEEAGSAVDQVTSATQNSRDGQSGRGSHGGSRQMPGQNSQAPEAGVTQQSPGRNSQGSPAAGKNGKNGKNASAKKNKVTQSEIQAVFDRLLAEGVITHEVYDAITAWLNSQSGAAAPAESAAPSETGDSAGTVTLLLKSLLDSGVITQEQYSLLTAALQSAPAVPVAN